MASRAGKHKPGSVRMGVYVEPFRKVVAVYLADIADMTLTDIIWEGIETVAKAKGVLPKWKCRAGAQSQHRVGSCSS